MGAKMFLVMKPGCLILQIAHYNAGMGEGGEGKGERVEGGEKERE